MFFRVLLKKSGSRTPRIEVEEMGPSLDLVLRRTHLASDDLMKAATKVPKVVKVSVTFTVVRSLFLSEAIKEHFCLKFLGITGFLCEPDNSFVSNVLVMVIHMCTCTILAIHFSGMCLFIQSRMNFRFSECTVKNYWYISRHAKTSVLTAL